LLALSVLAIVLSEKWLDVSAADKIKITNLQQHPAYSQNLYHFAYGDAIARWSKIKSQFSYG
jgi:hypothetical protein